MIILGALGTVLWAAGVAVDARTVRPAVQPCSSATVGWEPEKPRQGALFRVHVSGVASGVSVSGSVLRESLHFSPDSVRESLAAIPIDGPDSLTIVVRCSVGDHADSLTARVGSVRGDYPIERLRVAPAFGRRPDSATAARIDRESRRAAAIASGAHATPQLWVGPFDVPRDSRITSGFGGGREYNGTITSRHMGTDFAGATGAPVRAVNRGVVRIVDAFFYGGNVVYLDHGAGVSSAYLHLSKQLVAAGDTVARGQVIGRVGATGRVTGPHLHLIVRYGSITVDPMSLFAVASDSSGGTRR